MMRPFLATLLFCALAPTAFAPSARAQDFFVPGQARPPAGAPGPARPAAPRPAAPRQAAPPVQQPFVPQPSGGVGPGVEADAPPPVQFPMPPVPELPALAKGALPPVPQIGVIGVPDVMQAATAAQQIDRVIGERREKVNQDAQKEQAIWRDLQQTLANQRNTMAPDQVRIRERELQDRVTSAQRQFRERNTVIQEAAQVSLNQIQAVLIAVIRQVSESRGMNLVLHRNQVVLNINEFDITDQVTRELNVLLPSVTIPPDGTAPTEQPPVKLSGLSGPVPAAPGTPIPAAAPATPPTR